MLVYLCGIVSRQLLIDAHHHILRTVDILVVKNLDIISRSFQINFPNFIKLEVADVFLPMMEGLLV